MIKVTINIDGVEGSVKDINAVTLTEALECVEGALKGCGFSFNGRIQVVEDE